MGRSSSGSINGPLAFPLGLLDPIYLLDLRWWEPQFLGNSRTPWSMVGRKLLEWLDTHTGQEGLAEPQQAGECREEPPAPRED